ncbi:hypothetical protein K4F52_007143 [Lecanicillium sp. MT-2017a]|nr:hypothetical protein K4F52_007143 [Lecanicillium sp. MT-2017a]
MLRNAVVAAVAAASLAAATKCNVPSVQVPACPAVGTVQYSKSVPDKQDFPLTQVDLCYTDSSLAITFTAYNETNFYFDPEHGTNDPLYEYEVMEAFIYKGTDDPQTYLEFEVSPNNVTWQAFVYNPSKVRAEGAPFDHFFITNPSTDGFSSETKLDKEAEIWESAVKIPLGLFNVDIGKAKGTEWRMNFFRTVVSPETFPDQGLGAWSPPNKANFHITKYLGNVKFI